MSDSLVDSAANRADESIDRARGRWPRALAVALPVILVVAYVFVALSYRSGVPRAGDLPAASGPQPTVVLVPQAIDPNAQDPTGKLVSWR